MHFVRNKSYLVSARDLFDPKPKYEGPAEFISWIITNKVGKFRTPSGDYLTLGVEDVAYQLDNDNFSKPNDGGSNGYLK